ncbi:MAG: hypothetical protein QOF71_1084 [Candidatus Eremiobacteraeota bacterium]|jgi:hypothetical protein|nr:hypothetical protein [Candidatus Eremiobacteraeota bacterium]
MISFQPARRLAALLALVAVLAPLAAPASDYIGYALLWSRESSSGKTSLAAFSVEAVKTGYNVNRSDGKTIHFKKSIGEYARLIDEFYDKNPNARSVSPSAILLCLADTPVYDCTDLTKEKK